MIAPVHRDPRPSAGPARACRHCLCLGQGLVPTVGPVVRRSRRCLLCPGRPSDIRAGYGVCSQRPGFDRRSGADSVVAPDVSFTLPVRSIRFFVLFLRPCFDRAIVFVLASLFLPSVRSRHCFYPRGLLQTVCPVQTLFLS